MKKQLSIRKHLIFRLVVAVCGLGWCVAIKAQNTALSYEGQLLDKAAAANGNYDLRFSLFASETDGAPIGPPVEVLNAEVVNGQFRSRVNFEATLFPGEPRWLEVSVRRAGSADPHETLTPRHAVTPVPYALHALSAGGVAAASVNAGNLAVPAAPEPGQVLGFDGGTLVWKDGAGGGGVFSLNGADAYFSGGRVGIGTSAPSGALHVANGGLAVTGESSPYAGAGKGVFIESNPTFGGHVFAYDYAAGTPRSLLLNFPGGNIGVGTAAPRSKTEIEAVWDSNFGANLTLSGSRPSLIWRPSGSSGYHWLTQMQEGDLTFYHRFKTSLFGDIDTGWIPAARMHSSGMAVTGEMSATTVSYSGTISKLDTAEQFASTVRAADFLIGHSTRRGTPGRALVDWNDGVGLKALVVNWADDWTETHIGGKVTQVTTLRITGGADLSEPFAMSHRDVSPGAVVVIDDKNPGKLRLSSEAYDKKVAGVVSGANGIQPAISMIQENQLEAGENVALSGRVYVNANTSGGCIEPGDLLTTSDLPGEAMKAADHARAQGAILGKAMTRLEQGKGTVLVLVTLQ